VSETEPRVHINLAIAAYRKMLHCAMRHKEVKYLTTAEISVGTMNALMVGHLRNKSYITDKGRFSRIHSVRTESVTRQFSYKMGNEGFFPRVMGSDREAGHYSLSVLRLKIC
jgi:hypothetical protein